MSKNKVSGYLTQTDAYRFGKRQAIKQAQSDNETDVKIGVKLLYDLYKCNYLEIAQVILESYDLISLNCIPKKEYWCWGACLDVILPNSTLIIEAKPNVHFIDSSNITLDWQQVTVYVKKGDTIASTCTLNFKQNITFYALIEDELHQYLNPKK